MPRVGNIRLQLQYAEERALALQQRRERQTTETEEQREARLQRVGITHSERMASETEEQRDQAAEDACQSK